jgi:hypothetical protein
VISLLALAGISYAQFPPSPEGVTEIESKFGDGVRLSWKEVGLLLYPGSIEQELTATERPLRDHRGSPQLYWLCSPPTGQS